MNQRGLLFLGRLVGRKVPRGFPMWRVRGCLSIQPEQPRLLRRSFELLIQERIKTRDQIRLDLPFAVGDIEELSGLPRGFLMGDIYEIAIAPKIKGVGENEIGENEQATLLPFGKRNGAS